MSHGGPAAERPSGPAPEEGAPAEGDYPDVTDDGRLDGLLDSAEKGAAKDGESSSKDPEAAEAGPEESTSEEGSPDAGPSDDEAAVVEAVTVAEQIAKERDEYLDLARRVQADFENYKRRVEAQRDEQRERAAEDLLRELLPVLDAGEAAAALGADDATQLHLQLVGTLEKRGLTRVAEAGVDFDPNVHEAVAHEPGDESAPVVVEVLRTGYLWNERVLRPAMVKVRG